MTRRLSRDSVSAFSWAFPNVPVKIVFQTHFLTLLAHFQYVLTVKNTNVRELEFQVMIEDNLLQCDNLKSIT